MRRAPVFALMFVLVATSAFAAAKFKQGALTIAQGAKRAVLQVEVADTPEARAQGLMSRQRLAENAGMLFLFDDQALWGFWMKNTLIPLAVAFIADDGTVVNVDEMKAQTLDPHCSAKPVRFVLEMNTGWFTKHGVKAGSKLSGEPFGTPR